MLQQASLTNPALLPTILQGLQQSGATGSSNSDAMHLAAAAMMNAQSVSTRVDITISALVFSFCLQLQSALLNSTHSLASNQSPLIAGQCTAYTGLCVFLKNTSHAYIQYSKYTV